MKLKKYFSCFLAVSHEQMNRLAHYNKYAMGWMIRGSGFESRRSRDFFLFVIVSILALGLIQWISRFFAVGV